MTQDTADTRVTTVPRRTDRLPALPVRRDHSSAPGTLLYLPGTAQYVAPYHYDGGGWWCVCVGAPADRPAGGTLVHIGPADIATALDVPLPDPSADLPPDLYAGVWLARVTSRPCGGARRRIAELLAGELRDPDSLIVQIDTAARRRIVNAAHLRFPIVVDRTLDDLHRDRLLRREPAVDPAVARYRLVLPEWTVAAVSDATGKRT